MMANTWWLQCEVLPGLFETERVCLLREITYGKTLEIIVDKGLVQSDELPRSDRPVPGRLRVHRSGVGPGRADVLLSVATPEFGSVIAVADGQLAPAS
jgi:hypothetical protein